jgi:hypothetical protein
VSAGPKPRALVVGFACALVALWVPLTGGIFSAAVSASLDAISKADAAMARWVIDAGLKLIVVPIDSTWTRRSHRRWIAS